MTLMELLDTNVPINLPSLMLKHMQYILTQDMNKYALPYSFWLSKIFEAYSIPIQVWTMYTTKDVLGHINCVALHGSMWHTNISLHRFQTALDAKTVELISVHQEFEQKSSALLSRISELEDTLHKERVAYAEIVHKISLLILSSIPLTLAIPGTIYFLGS